MSLSPEELKKMREDAGFTQSEIAIEVGVSQSYIARLERGTLDPKLSVVNKIVEVINQRRTTLCSEVMTVDPLTVDARDLVTIAIGIMRDNDYSQLPVVRGTRTVGLLTERDVIRNLNRDLEGLSVQAIMSPEGVPMVDESTPVDAVLPLFQIYQAVLVLSQGRLTGIISRSDLLSLRT
ncbi:MAG: CBS domain-containing protein [Candidatus Hodarchaeota archaeon]